MPEDTYKEIGIACLNSEGKVKAGTLLRQQKPWIGTKWIAGQWPGVNHQNDVFGYPGRETLFWAQPNDWREINFLESTNTDPSNTKGVGEF